MINRRRIPLILSSLAAAGVAFAVDTSSSPSAATGEPASSTISSGASAASAAPGIVTYKSVKGDSFTKVADKFGCTVRALKRFNDIKGTHLHVGTVLQIPPSKHRHALAAEAKKKQKSTASAPLTAEERKKLAFEEALKATDKLSHHRSPVAQPVQDFDLSPSVFASCPVPPSNGSESDLAADAEADQVPRQASASASRSEYPAPLVANNRHTSLLPVPNIAPIAPPTPKPTQATPTRTPANLAHQPATPVLTPPVEHKGFASALASFFGGSHGLSASESGEWGNKFLSQTRQLASVGIGYDHSWRPDGEERSWEMDCSNTSRYLYRVTAGIELPRTASDQYYYLHLQDKAWDVPMTSTGFADCNFLRSNLKPGDLLFWENTYRPERQPPITHVMIFLGTDARGRWLMAGSQGSRGFYNPHHSGPDVYVFDPTHSVGGYTTWLGLVHHRGRFVAYGRPLEADIKKLSVASSE